MHAALNRRVAPAGVEQAAGFTLLEVLTALLITTLAVTGIAALQLNALTMTHEANLRTTATLLARDWINRMRANAAANPADFDFACWTDRQDCAQSHPECRRADHHNAPCTPAELAQDDYAHWGDRLALQLPGGRGRLCRDDDGGAHADACADAAAGDAFVLTIAWHERHAQIPCPMLRPTDPDTACLSFGFRHDPRWTRPSWSAQ